MINLLPDNTKKEIRAARLNSIFIKYFLILIAAFAFLTISYITVYLVLTSNTSETSAVSTANNQATVEYNSIKSQYDNLYANFSSAKQILGQQISYSDIIIGIGAQLPQGVVIDQLSLSNEKIGSPITIKAKAESENSVSKLKDSFKDSQLFTNVNIQSAGSSGSSAYPVSVSINLTINREIAL